MNDVQRQIALALKIDLMAARERPKECRTESVYAARICIGTICGIYQLSDESFDRREFLRIAGVFDNEDK